MEWKLTELQWYEQVQIVDHARDNGKDDIWKQAREPERSHNGAGSRSVIDAGRHRIHCIHGSLEQLEEQLCLVGRGNILDADCSDVQRHHLPHKHGRKRRWRWRRGRRGLMFMNVGWLVCRCR
jgi:hypothetical protein